MTAKPETALVKACLGLLRLRGCFCWRNNSGAVVLGEGKSRRFFRAGLVGSADIIGVVGPAGAPHGGKFIAVEVKVGRNRPTPAQEAFAAAVRDAGGLAFTVWSLKDLEGLLDEAGI